MKVSYGYYVKSLKTIFSDNLKSLRKSKRPKITLDEMALRMGKSKQAIFRWENAQAWPSAEDIEKLAEILDVSPHMLFMDAQADSQVTPGIQELKQTLLETTKTLKFFQEQMEKPEFFEKKKSKK